MRQKLSTIGRAIFVLYGAGFTFLTIPLVLSLLSPVAPGGETREPLQTAVFLAVGTVWVVAVTCWVVVPLGVVLGLLAWPWVGAAQTRRAVVRRGAGVGLVLAVLAGSGWPLFELGEWAHRTNIYEILGQLPYVGKHLLAALLYSLLAACSFVPWFAGRAWLASRENAVPGIVKPESTGPEP